MPPRTSKPDPKMTREDFHKLLKKAATTPVPKPSPKGNKHRLGVVAAVVAKSVLVQVGLEILAANGVIDSTDPALYQTPESLNRLVCASPMT